MYDTPLDTTHRQLRLTVIVDFHHSDDEQSIQIRAHNISNGIHALISDYYVADVTVDDGGELVDADTEGNVVK